MGCSEEEEEGKEIEEGIDDTAIDMVEVGEFLVRQGRG